MSANVAAFKTAAAPLPELSRVNRPGKAGRTGSVTGFDDKPLYSYTTVVDVFPAIPNGAIAPTCPTFPYSNGAATPSNSTRPPSTFGAYRISAGPYVAPNSTTISPGATAPPA